MKLSRRDLLRAASLIGGAATLFGCDSVYSEVSERLGQTLPDHLSVPDDNTVDPAFHLLSRAAFGPWPGDLEYVRDKGRENWIEEQLNPEKIDDTAAELRARRYETIHLDPGSCYDFKRESLRNDLIRYSLLKCIYSKRQLFEVMVGFWTDHLNIYIEKGDCMNLKASDDRTVVRPHALGKFRDLIRASALSPAMLVYLDGKENKKEGPAGIPNENYARELLELHTLGVNGGYTQKDVFEVARCFTGWRLKESWQRGTVWFDGTLHDDDAKIVLGRKIPAGGGEKDVDRVIDVVSSHPSTALYIATKMVKKFVTENPPRELVNSVAATFRNTDGDIKAMLRQILNSHQFENARCNRLKRPFHFVVSSLRALAADTHAKDPLIEYSTRMGHGPFQYPTPDGYPDDAAPWLGTLLWRWNFAFALAANSVPGVNVSIERMMNSLDLNESSENLHSKMLAYFVGRCENSSESAALTEYISSRDLSSVSNRAELIGLIMASPAFQRY